MTGARGGCIVLLTNDGEWVNIMRGIAFIDTEVGTRDHRIHDIGAVRGDGAIFHAASPRELLAFISGAEFICGHNPLRHDLKYLHAALGGEVPGRVIDTLYLSPLLFPERAGHSLSKDEKLRSEEANNPVNDCLKARDLLDEEISAFLALPERVRQIYRGLLYAQPEFCGFFDYVDCGASAPEALAGAIRAEFDGRICANADIEALIERQPVELAYALARIGAGGELPLTPAWLALNYPHVEAVVARLRGVPCEGGCAYCRRALDARRRLKEFFGYDGFRSYGGEPLQEKAVRAAVEGKSLLAVFPTGGGKSLTFQLPALMAGEAERGLTVVISPLQSLMKDQVDNLSARGIASAVTINGLLSPVERADACARVLNGAATLLYISPEQLRSRTVERMLLSRRVARFVIDEAHCFSAWGQDFRVDYLYIGDFIRGLLEQKHLAPGAIPVSCFTATAKQQVISDIRDYFRQKLGLELMVFATAADRENLRYSVRNLSRDAEKYGALRDLIEEKDCPTIVYVSRTKRAQELANRLTRDGIPALPYHGKMEAREKVANQEAFIRNEVRAIVATSAFGMGVDKSDVGLVVHFDMSDSLENYTQEAGRAGRDPAIQADCCVLFCEDDLDEHFALLNRSKLGMGEIQQVWRAIKGMTSKEHPTLCCSALELARAAGWDDSSSDVETRVRTAVAALESANYIRRGRNVPHVYATSIHARDMVEAGACIERSPLFDDAQRETAKRILKSLIASRSRSEADAGEAESRIDYLADTLGLEKRAVLESINLMRQAGLLDDSRDMTAYIPRRKPVQALGHFARLEEFLLTKIGEAGMPGNLKELNEAALAAGIRQSCVKDILTLIYYLTIRDYIRREEGGATVLAQPLPALLRRARLRFDLCRHILDALYASVPREDSNEGREARVVFSEIELLRSYAPPLGAETESAALRDVEDALLYLSKIGAVRLEGGFLVLYSAMEIERLVLDNRRLYLKKDYRTLDEFYRQKVLQIHIAGEYARLMARDSAAALALVRDYFAMEFSRFLSKHFSGERRAEIERNITPARYRKLFGALSAIQAEIIGDAESRCIVVAAGPGSGKTRILVHKLAALLLMEDVRHEQLLMLTFSRAAATEFKLRLRELIGSAANFVEISTFHSYCFRLLGTSGSIEDSESAVRAATQMISSGRVEQSRIAKRVLVIDEAQDMAEDEFRLIQALIACNDELRVIAVGDDDQNIYEFRGADSKYLRELCDADGAKMYEMTQNYRSRASIVALANAFAATMEGRMKSSPIVAANREAGVVQIIRHCGARFTEAVAEHVRQTYADGTRAGVLTATNDEALAVLGALLRRGVRAKLIQSTDRINLYNLVEIRHFLSLIEAECAGAVIPAELWARATRATLDAYADTPTHEILRNLFRRFREVNPTPRLDELREFIRESNYEDFYDDQAQVCVSTIHKSKGREFDAVYMLLDNFRADAPEQKRQLYVGLTRAKSALYIHCNSDLFANCAVPGVEFVTDTASYPATSEIALNLSYRDVMLDFFKDRADLVQSLRAGSPLLVADPYLSVNQGGQPARVAKFSRAFAEKLAGFRSRGYVPVRAEVRFIVAWKGRNDATETLILLPNLYLRRF